MNKIDAKYFAPPSATLSQFKICYFSGEYNKSSNFAQITKKKSKNPIGVARVEDPGGGWRKMTFSPEFQYVKEREKKRQ